MAVMDIRPFLNMMPAVRESPERSVWLTYDSGADALYIHYRKPNTATDSELTDDDVVLRYKGDELIGMTVLHASSR
jgi:uncharacterized protein YuzE